MLFLLVPQTAPTKAVRIEVPNASPLYSLQLQIKGDPSDEPLTGPGQVTIRSRKEGRFIQVISVPSITLFKDRVSKSIDLKAKYPGPYGDTYTAIFQDFDFDGVQDFAICKDLNGGYGGPTYAIYRWSPRSKRFIADNTLTRLSSEHLGLVDVDPQKKTLATLDKDGAGWHKLSTYRWQSGRVVLVEEQIEDYRGGKGVITTRTKVGSKWKVQVRKETIRP